MAERRVVPPTCQLTHYLKVNVKSIVLVRKLVVNLALSRKMVILSLATEKLGRSFSNHLNAWQCENKTQKQSRVVAST